MKRRYTILGLTSVLAIALAVPALGGPSNPVAEGAASAKKIAKQAKKKAKKANKKAKQAQSTADGVAVAAAEAQSTANSANAAATDAQSTADNALGAATAAQGSADAAQASADAAQSTADSAFKTKDFNQGAGSGASTSASKSDTAVCDSGDTLAGGGYVMSGNGANNIAVTIDSSYVNAWIASGTRVDGQAAESWEITATVECFGK